MNKTVDELKFIKRQLGVKLTEIVLATKITIINKWINELEEPTHRQKYVIEQTKEILQVLADYLPSNDMKIWLVTHSEYLYGVPAVELRRRPEDVKYAALNRVSRGEVIEVWQGE